MGLLLCAGLWHSGTAQSILQGKVVEIDNGIEVPLVGVNIFYPALSSATTTDVEGRFQIGHHVGQILVVSYVGYGQDSLIVSAEDKELNLVMESSVRLEEVEIRFKRRSINISSLDTRKVEVISQTELRKAACCNLSESFETNPSIDVSFTDAITGTRQIEMLGLSGPNIQITRELIPEVRGLMSGYGLEFTPGVWIESIQLNKGTGSVINGYESMTGQINTELLKPTDMKPLTINLYTNRMQRLEANVTIRHMIEGSDLSAATLLHAKSNQQRRDVNKDGFLDVPLRTVYTGLHRWKYDGGEWQAQAGIKGSYMNSQGGQMEFRPEEKGSMETWGYGLEVRRLDAFIKGGRVWQDIPWRSVGMQLAMSSHNQTSYFGLRPYDATQTSLYGNFIYETILSNVNHGLTTGLSIYYDDFDETVGLTAENIVGYDFREIIPGAFAEYHYDDEGDFSATAGLRVDHHNLYGVYVTPRLHLRYAATEETILRLSMGRGQRTAQIFAENYGLLASARSVIIEGTNPDLPHCLEAEVAWNIGVSMTQDFRLAGRDAALGIDLFRTHFTNQIIVNLDRDPQEIVFSNLDGESYSWSAQAQVDYEIVDGLDVRLAYRYYDVKSTYDGRLLRRPFVANQRAFVNVGYVTPRAWSLDLTVNWQSNKRLPFTGSSPQQFQRDQYSPDFVLINAQVRKDWGPKWSVYLGAENILDFRQQDPIIAATDPFGEHFDSALVWGPVMGRNIYVGATYTLID